MSLRTILLLGLALLLAAGTAVFARNWIVNERAQILASVPAQQAPKTLNTVRVLVSSKALPVGTFLTENKVEWREWPEDGVGDGYVIEGEGSIDKLKGAVVRTAMNAGEPITPSRVVHPGERGFLAAVLEPGMRAVAVPVNATTGIAGLVFPGDKVDVLLSVRMRGKTETAGNGNQTRYFSETLLHGIRVLAIDQTLNNDGKAEVGKTATLEVSPKQAEKVAVALEMGSLSLSLESLARRGDRFSQVAENVGALPAETTPHRSYTLDMDVYHMLGDPRLFGRKGRAARQINVLRGGDAATAKF